MIRGQLREGAADLNKSSRPLVLERGSTRFVIKPEVLCLAFRIRPQLAQTNFHSHLTQTTCCDLGLPPFWSLKAASNCLLACP